MKFFVLILLMFFSNFSFALTFKSDGSIISKNGEILKESNADIFTQHYLNFKNNSKISGWPLAGDLNQKGYFGSKIFINGFPLPKNPNGRFNLDEIAKFNGLSKNEFITMIIAFSNDDWLSKNNIEKSMALELRKNIQSKVNIELNIINDFYDQLTKTINQIENNISNEVSNESSSLGSMSCSEPASGVADAGGGQSSGLGPNC